MRVGCALCRFTGVKALPEVRDSGGVLIRAARSIPCPDCGGVKHWRVRVIEPREWADGMRRACDLLS